MLRAARLDDVNGALTVQATRLVGEVGCFIYSFRVSAEATRSCWKGAHPYSSNTSTTNYEASLGHRRQRSNRAPISRQLAQEHLHVIIHAHRNRATAEEVTNQIIEAGGSASVACFDVSDTQATQRALAQILEAASIQVLREQCSIYDDARCACGRPMEPRDRCLPGGFFNVTQPLLLPMIGTRWDGSSRFRRSRPAWQSRPDELRSGQSGAPRASKSLAQEVASRGVTVKWWRWFIESRMNQQS